MVTHPGLLMWRVAWAKELEMRRDAERQRMIEEWTRTRRRETSTAADLRSATRREERGISPTEG